jgi:predicted oxidoreductase
MPPSAAAATPGGFPAFFGLWLDSAGIRLPVLAIRGVDAARGTMNSL